MTRRANHRRQLAAAAVSLLLLTGACTPTSEPAAEARPDSIVQQWFDRYHDARRQGTDNLAAFYDPDVVQTNGPFDAGRAYGRAEVLAALDDQLPSDVYTRNPARGIYLGPDTALTLERIESTGSMLPEDATFLHTMASHGIARQAYALSILASRRADPADVRLLAVDHLVKRYLATWSTGSGADHTDLYAPGARLLDPLLAIEAPASERAALLDVPVSQGGLAGSAVTQLPDHGGPAVFVAGPPDVRKPLNRLVLLLDIDTASGCRAAMAVVATLDEAGLITEELRLHRDDDWVLCSPGRALPAGWWETATVPEAVTRVGTGELELGGSSVAMFNSTPGLDQLVRWGHSRFLEAGLGWPALAEVTFYSPEVDLCRRIHGMAFSSGVILCLDEERACLGDGCTAWRAWARAALLHELAHGWIDRNVTPDAATEFTARVGLPTWSSTREPWGQRGVELAAETIAWALADEPIQTNRKLGPRSCQELSDLYSSLTGQQPRSACVESGTSGL